MARKRKAKTYANRADKLAQSVRRFVFDMLGRGSGADLASKLAESFARKRLMINAPQSESATEQPVKQGRPVIAVSPGVEYIPPTIKRVR